MPTLAAGDIVIMDNLSCRKSPALGRAIEAVGAQLWFLPKYSPDLNPINKLVLASRAGFVPEGRGA